MHSSTATGLNGFSSFADECVQWYLHADTCGGETQSNTTGHRVRYIGIEPTSKATAVRRRRTYIWGSHTHSTRVICFMTVTDRELLPSDLRIPVTPYNTLRITHFLYNKTSRSVQPLPGSCQRSLTIRVHPDCLQLQLDHGFLRITLAVSRLWISLLGKSESSSVETDFCRAFLFSKTPPTRPNETGATPGQLNYRDAHCATRSYILPSTLGHGSDQV